ncbi:MAG TPA: discoidin domain-containing protein [Polyangia bacterium]
MSGTPDATSTTDLAADRGATDTASRPDAPGPVTGANWPYTGCNQAQIMYPRIDSNNGRFPPGSCPPPETLKPVCPGGSKIPVMMATASSFETAFPHPPAYAIDDHLTTRWSTNPGATGWIVLDLGSEKTFQRLYLLWELAHGSGYNIEVSNDSRAWTPITMVRDGNGFQDILDVDGKGRYIRMNGVTRGSTGNVPQCCAAPGTLHGYSLFDFTVCAER